jgi:hypothetical protein
MLVSCSAYYSALKMEPICSSETSIDFQRTSRRYIPEDSILRTLYSSEWFQKEILIHSSLEYHTIASKTAIGNEVMAEKFMRLGFGGGWWRVTTLRVYIMSSLPSKNNRLGSRSLFVWPNMTGGVHKRYFLYKNMFGVKIFFSRCHIDHMQDVIQSNVK